MLRAVLCLLLLCHGGAAAAYVDPNLGGILYQLLFPVFLAVLAFWNYLRRLVRAAIGWLRTQGKARSGR